DFLQCMNEVSGFDFSQFENWYSQAGTPRLAVTDEYNEAEKAYTLTVRQSCPATPEAQVKKPFHLPLSLGLLDADGQDMSLTLEGEDESSTTKILEIRQDVQTFTFVNIDEKPTPSLLRHFSAPVKLEFPYSQDQLLFLLKHDSDAFNRYEAAQRLIKGEVDQLVHAFQENTKYEVNRHVLDALGHVLTAPAIDPAFKAELLQVPSVASLIEEMEMADFAAADFATGEFTKTFARTFEFQLSSIYLKLQADKENSLSQEAVAARSLKHCVLAFLISLETPEAIQFAWKQFYQAQNMTDEKSAMFLLAQIDCHENDKALRCFYSKWNHAQLVINSWFTCQAASKIPGALDRVKRLVKDACFDITNPNKIASLFTTLAGNLVQFHDKSGEVYAYIAQKILEIDRFNPSAASRLALVFKKYKTLNPHCKMLIKGEIDKLLADKKLSTNSRDHLEKIISK
ncbi:MAG: DUF3458 domain-containing protein, partial [Lentisphaeraceae bacterium]|nr:DUF3458 domain-containing protein [Lentisphaeraceae bacterium]